MFQLDAPDASHPLAAAPPSALPRAIGRVAESLGGPAAEAAFLYDPSIAARRAARLRAALPGYSSAARSAFGDEVVEHLARAAQGELDAFAAGVTDWERERAFVRL